ncbi:MAG: ribonucleotide-diphosphate reductase subunit beta [Truepera sp.]|nr:ribonucleotide-diphosphate reductase subunit beta [Truepera sp.]
MLTDRRMHLRPVEYPQFLAYRDAIRHSYWLHTEFNLTEDVHDFRARVTAAERQAITRTMLAIAQVEVAVKTFWGDIYKRFPKPEVAAVGYTFAESEVRHQDAYAHLLELLGLNREFERLDQVPAMQARLAVLNQHLAQPPSLRTDCDGRAYAFSILLFSVFVEHVSLFGQFLIMKAFDKSHQLFKGIANIVEATSKEEQIHGLFGYQLLEILKLEFPHWFDDAFYDEVARACRQAYMAERAILDWIFEDGELGFLPRTQIEAFIQHRFNTSLETIGLTPLWTVDPVAVAATLWFEEELLAGKHVDFFHKRPTAYAKKVKTFSEDDLFG